MNKGLTKEHSQILYGLAILLMLYHHLFCMPERLGYEYFSVLNCIFGDGVEQKIAWFGKICVAIFAFITGYALQIKYANCNDFLQIYRNILKQIFSLLKKYWIVCLIFIPIGLAIQTISLNAKSLILTLFFDGTIINIEWWYVRFYVMVLIFSPLIIAVYRIVKGKFLKSRLSFIAPSLILLMLCMWLINYFQIQPYLLIIALGYLVADWNIYEKITNKMCVWNCNKTVLNFILLLVCIITRILIVKEAGSYMIDIILIIPFIYSAANLLNKTKIVKRILKFFAKYSTYMWLTHTFFTYYYFQRFSTISQISTVIYLQNILVSLLTAVVLSFIEKKVDIFIKYINQKIKL